MASQSGVYRVLVIPFGTSDSGTVDEAGLLNKVATLINSTTNVLVAAIGIGYEMFQVFSGGAFHFGRGIKVEIWATTAGDAAIAGNLPTFQTSVGTAVYTWSIPITWGF